MEKRCQKRFCTSNMVRGTEFNIQDLLGDTTNAPTKVEVVVAEEVPKDYNGVS